MSKPKKLFERRPKGTAAAIAEKRAIQRCVKQNERNTRRGLTNRDAFKEIKV